VPVNFTTEVVSDFLTAMAFFYGFVVSINQIRKGINYRFYQYSAFAWLTMGTCCLLFGIANLLLIIEIEKVALIFYTIGAFFVLLKAETLKREQVEPVKLTIFLILGSAAVIFFYVFPNAVTETTIANGAKLIYIDPILGSPFLGACGLSLVYYLYCTYLVNKKAPTPLKGYSRAYFTGFFLCVCSVSLWGTINPIVPGYPLLIGTVGVFMVAYSYSREPKLLFVLPFTALRLTVLETESGLPLFTHTWNRLGNLADEDLFSGMLQGISIIVRQSLKRGDVQEIRVADAIIIAFRNPDYPVAYVLVATRPSRSLRDGLKLFAERFCGEFHDCFATASDADQFNGAENLVTSCFPHVPVYD